MIINSIFLYSTVLYCRVFELYTVQSFQLCNTIILKAFETAVPCFESQLNSVNSDIHFILFLWNKYNNLEALEMFCWWNVCLTPHYMSSCTTRSIQDRFLSAWCVHPVFDWHVWIFTVNSFFMQPTKFPALCKICLWQIYFLNLLQWKVIVSWIQSMHHAVKYLVQPWVNFKIFYSGRRLKNQAI